MTTHAAAAKAIRNELKTIFPSVKFSVTSESFSMGNAVHISWIDGCTTEQVEKIVSKYQYGHFNSMEDIYESDDRPELWQGIGGSTSDLFSLKPGGNDSRQIER